MRCGAAPAFVDPRQVPAADAPLGAAGPNSSAPTRGVQRRGAAGARPDAAGLLQDAGAVLLLLRGLRARPIGTGGSSSASQLTAQASRRAGKQPPARCTAAATRLCLFSLRARCSLCPASAVADFASRAHVVFSGSCPPTTTPLAGARQCGPLHAHRLAPILFKTRAATGPKPAECASSAHANLSTGPALATASSWAHSSHLRPAVAATPIT